jgi:hypothetical protein
MRNDQSRQPFPLNEFDYSPLHSFSANRYAMHFCCVFGETIGVLGHCGDSQGLTVFLLALLAFFPA